LYVIQTNTSSLEIVGAVAVTLFILLVPALSALITAPLLAFLLKAWGKPAL
jgi:hypothetical protein